MAGAAAIEMSMPAGSTVADLRRRLTADYPRLAGLLPDCAIAVDEEFADDDSEVSPDAEVAVLPPVSGGERRTAPAVSKRSKTGRGLEHGIDSGCRTVRPPRASPGLYEHQPAAVFSAATVFS